MVASRYRASTARGSSRSNRSSACLTSSTRSGTAWRTSRKAATAGGRFTLLNQASPVATRTAGGSGGRGRRIAAEKRGRAGGEADGVRQRRPRLETTQHLDHRRSGLGRRLGHEDGDAQELHGLLGMGGD